MNTPMINQSRKNKRDFIELITDQLLEVFQANLISTKVLLYLNFMSRMFQANPRLIRLVDYSMRA